MRTKLKYVVDIVNGATPSTAEPDYWDGSIEWATPDDLGKLTDKYIFHTTRKITDAGLANCGASLSPKGSILLSTRAPIGHIAISQIPICCNQGCRILKPTSHIETSYMYYCLSDSKACLNALGQGSTFVELSRERLAAMQINLPPIEEQKAIASFLDKETDRIDALIQKKGRMIELLKEKRIALITKAVTKGLDPNVPMKDSGIEWLGKVPEHWEVRRFRFLLQAPLQYGAIESAELDDPDLPRYIRITDIDENGKLRAEGVKSIAWENAKPYMLNDGDLLFARSGATAGKTLLWESKWGAAAFAGYLIRATFNDQVKPKFANYFTASAIYLNWLAMTFIQATIQNISAEKYKELPIPIPDTDEQSRIVEYLDIEISRMDSLTNAVLKSLSLLREYRASLIHHAVTGKIDLRGYDAQA